MSLTVSSSSYGPSLGAEEPPAEVSIRSRLGLLFWPLMADDMVTKGAQPRSYEVRPLSTSIRRYDRHVSKGSVSVKRAGKSCRFVVNRPRCRPWYGLIDLGTRFYTKDEAGRCTIALGQRHSLVDRRLIHPGLKVAPESSHVARALDM